jgi:para-aminobenzoate synthetase component 1
VFQQLNAKTNAPYAAYLSFKNHRFLCASPELFLRKKGEKLFSSPIKGTKPRGTNREEDIAFKTALKNDIKERGENVMIVDLVRNDLSRIAEKNSVKVEELFEVYSFQTVHHMISTVSCTKRQDATLYDVLKATFPMGSMTGAPKISAMKLADELEFTGRGAYSGSIGCIFPNGDYEFNVIIRTIMVDTNKMLAMYHVGGAITALCNPEQEFEETMLKGKALMNLNQQQ